MNPCITILLLALLFHKFNFSDGQLIESLQYVELGKTATVNCTAFDADFIGVWWYKTSIKSADELLIYSLESVKGGVGFISGEYDIDPKGSLLIQTVSLDHEGFFKVKYLLSQKVQPVKHEVHVIVLVKPLLPFPLIESCGDDSNICFRQLNTTELNCFVDRVRPDITLEWEMRTEQGCTTILADTFTLRRDSLYSLRTTTKDAFQNTSILALLVCKANAPPRMFEEHDESLILVENNKKNTNVNFISRKIELHSKLELNCTQTKVNFLVWKKTNLRKELEEVLLYAVFLSQNLTRVNSGGYEMGITGSLVIQQVEVQHEGVYTCIYSDGFTDGVTVYNITVYVLPVPTYPTVTGCHEEQNCVLVLERQGSLTCSVKGIRPVATIEWSTLHERDSPLISFTHDQVKTTENGDTFAVSRTSTYRASKDAGEKLIIKCKTSLTNMGVFYTGTTIVTIYFTSDMQTVTETATTTGKTTTPHWYFIMTWVLCFSALLIVGAICTIPGLQQECIRRRVSDHSSAKEEVNGHSTKYRILSQLKKRQSGDTTNAPNGYHNVEETTV